jgi:hypothetical protein
MKLVIIKLKYYPSSYNFYSIGKIKTFNNCFNNTDELIICKR